MWLLTSRETDGPVPGRRLVVPPLDTAVPGRIAADRLSTPVRPALRALIAGAGGNPGPVVSLVIGLNLEAARRPQGPSRRPARPGRPLPGGLQRRTARLHRRSTT